MKIKCKHCGEVIEGDKKGTYITCKCGKIAIDETEHYCRINGNREDFEEVINCLGVLNDKVEILEEDKPIIEKINLDREPLKGRIMKIINNSDLTYEDLGYFIDRLRDKEENLYIGQKKRYLFGIRGMKYIIKIKQLTNEFRIEVSKYGLQGNDKDVITKRT